ncbi:MBL fold metallo-hydrolase [Solirubrobacter sp. CPCC 204708]|uniref:MBL fold metallo-hydrolase n=1 Tax=Solirubrobacter deserti TaxID=2282478 RepID=A0ABT4RFP6_9ACTN|nr:MBL fold metallo-hydrolase [Solirubrobacter deserti]MBE2318092.1 MBL fold metallo-hydrolase [Solirubrobacter deserti]MDA0137370.1 MBL fold metallo-hydrolase [Solirubrobacter deserti]
MITRVRADNPSPLTLSGTNTYVVEEAWVIDPGPLFEPHLDAVVAAVAAPAGVLVTHSHADHSEAAGELADRLGVPVVDGLADGDRIGPFDVLHIPGHADDHLVFVAGRHAFTGDVVLGEGSVFVSGRLREYLDGLRRLRALGLERIHPGHGDEIDDPQAKLDEYLAHRAERERKLVAALEAGVAPDDAEALLDAAWPDAPVEVRPFAAITLRAHLGKLREEGRLGVPPSA